MEPRSLGTERDLDDLVYGIHAVEEALTSGERLRSVHVAADRRSDPALRGLLARASAQRVPLRYERRAFFARLPFKGHQGVAASVHAFEYATLPDVLARRPSKPRLLVVLDHLTDPHNVGAIVRTAECVGADAVVLPDRRSAGINATVRKAAAGATAHVPIARVTNLARAIGAMKESGVWIAGADAGSEALEMTEVDFDRDLALVIGGEGGGLAPLIKRECDYLVRIPMYGRIASLNASVAAALLLYEALRQRKSAPYP